MERRVKETYGVSFAAHYAIKAEIGKSSLRRAQWKLAVEERNPTMLIWLGKQILKQKDKHEVSIEFPKPTIIVRPNGEHVQIGVSDVKTIEHDNTGNNSQE